MRFQRNTTICFLAICLIIITTACDAHLVGLTVTPTKHNFNKVNIGDYVEYPVNITNTSAAAVRISNFNVMGAPSFTIVSGNIAKLLQSNQRHRLTLRFEPTNAGVQSATVQIFHNGPGKTRTISLSGTGVAVPKISVPATSDFGTVGIGLTPTYDIDIENPGSAPLIISFFNFNGNATLFSIANGGNTPVTVLPGATHTISIRFAPTVVGNFPTVLEIAHNAVNAVPPAKINISAAGGGGRIEFNQTSPWDFGQAKTGTDKTDVIQVSNTGSVDLNISSIDISTGNAYRVDSVKNSAGNPITAPFDISPADHVEITIKFSPTTAGNYNDSLLIANDGSYAVSPATIDLTGSGRAPILQTYNYSGNITNFVVPAGITSATIEAWGAQGGDVNAMGGKGARMKGDFILTPGNSLKILVGQRGFDGTGYPTYDGGGGGGGSFVCKSNNDPMLIAGGGGGYHNYNSRPQTTQDGRITADGGDTYQNGGGNNGQGGQSGITNGPASGGGGLLTDGGNGSSGTGGKAFVNGGAGGAGNRGTYIGGNGGFGGGGGSYHNSIERCGGGGGYSGGQGGTCSAQASGGGGGSYNNGTNKSNTAGVKTSNGQIVISY